MKSHLRPHILFVAACVLFSFAMSLVLSRIVFERLPHLEDELAYVFQARILARGQLTLATPEPRIAFWQPFVVDRDGARFGKYPLGFPAQLALGEIAGAAWMVNALLGALAVAVIYRLGSEIFNRRVGIIAALLLAFSPMALLLNATLMGHTSALVFTLLFMWAYGRIRLRTEDWVMSEKRGDEVRWALVGGVALGMVVANRPAAAVGVALPYIAWSALRLWAARRGGWAAFWRTLRPLLVLALAVLPFAAIIPLFNYAAAGDPTTNLYTLVWQYDRAGFGECCGRSGHSLERAFNHLRYDLSLFAADLHGIQIGSFTPEVVDHLLRRADTYPNLGLSFLLPLFGVLVAFWRARVRLAIWLAGTAVWLALPAMLPGEFRTSASAWVWVVGAGIWVLLVLSTEDWVLRKARGQAALTCSGAQVESSENLSTQSSALSPRTRRASSFQERSVLLAVALMPILVHMTYWVGSQRYSTRYYYEGVGAMVLFSAVGLAWLTARLRAGWALALVTAGCLVTLATYSLPRIGVLHGFNNVSQSWIDAARARANPGERLLVIATGTNVSWRALGSFMAVTSPFLDSEIIGVYNRVDTPGLPGVRYRMLDLFPDRVIIELTAEGEDAAFVGE
jgi:4-amino-4-deoxy-L-arabinose transferase-like glycosyltransferase